MNDIRNVKLFYGGPNASFACSSAHAVRYAVPFYTATDLRLRLRCPFCLQSFFEPLDKRQSCVKWAMRISHNNQEFDLALKLTIKKYLSHGEVFFLVDLRRLRLLLRVLRTLRCPFCQQSPLRAFGQKARRILRISGVRSSFLIQNKTKTPQNGEFFVLWWT